MNQEVCICSIEMPYGKQVALCTPHSQDGKIGVLVLRQWMPEDYVQSLEKDLLDNSKLSTVNIAVPADDVAILNQYRFTLVDNNRVHYVGEGYPAASVPHFELIDTTLFGNHPLWLEITRLTDMDSYDTAMSQYHLIIQMHDVNTAYRQELDRLQREYEEKLQALRNAFDLSWSHGDAVFGVAIDEKHVLVKGVFTASSEGMPDYYMKSEDDE